MNIYTNIKNDSNIIINRTNSRASCRININILNLFPSHNSKYINSNRQ